MCNSHCCPCMDKAATKSAFMALTSSADIVLAWSIWMMPWRLAQCFANGTLKWSGIAASLACNASAVCNTSSMWFSSASVAFLGTSELRFRLSDLVLATSLHLGRWLTRISFSTLRPGDVLGLRRLRPVAVKKSRLCARERLDLACPRSSKFLHGDTEFDWERCLKLEREANALERGGGAPELGSPLVPRETVAPASLLVEGVRLFINREASAFLCLARTLICSPGLWLRLLGPSSPSALASLLGTWGPACFKTPA